jgi:hypothetical protein
MVKASFYFVHFFLGFDDDDVILLYGTALSLKPFALPPSPLPQSQQINVYEI